MRLSWNEIRTRAAAFAREWADATYEKGETQSFYNEFFDIFGVRRRSVARYEEHVHRLDNTSGFIDLFWPGVLLVEQKSAGHDLTAARDQTGTYFDALPERDRPRYQLLCDFQTFELSGPGGTRGEPPSPSPTFPSMSRSSGSSSACSAGHSATRIQSTSRRRS